jgi:lysophospholipase L1-like esterase
MPLACEIRLNNPSLILIHFGTNDWTETYENNMRQIIEFSIGEGVIPVLITKANRIDKQNQRNDILRQLAAEYHIPLWDFDIIANTLPDRGLAQDDAHLSVANDFDYSASQNLTQGYKAFNLSGLIFLDAFLREVVYNGT